MKRWINNSNSVPIIDIDIFTDHPLLHMDDFRHVAASVDLSEYDLPNRPVISKDRNRITGEMIDDFEAFVEDVESLCEDKYDLVLVYENVSPDLSHYYSYLVKDEDGEIIVKIRIRLRISNHLPKKSQKQKEHKKSELDSEALRNLLTEEEIINLDQYTLIITINDTKFDNYEEAFRYTSKKIARAIEVVRGRS